MEVCHINVWGTVCGDSYWGLADAQVACRQLGLPTTGATTLSVSAVPESTRVSWFYYVDCVGTESSLFNCGRLPSERNCYRSRYAGVSCQDSKSEIIKTCSFSMHHFCKLKNVWRGKFLKILTSFAYTLIEVINISAITTIGCVVMKLKIIANLLFLFKIGFKNY